MFGNHHPGGAASEMQWRHRMARSPGLTPDRILDFSLGVGNAGVSWGPASGLLV
jgi:hypothetical protein